MVEKKRTHAYSEYDKEYSLKYRKEKKEQMNIDLNVGEKAMFKAFAADQGESMAGLVRKLLYAEMERTGWEYKEEGGA